ncbi:protein mesh-like [Actinia tenebrosa]|uniref:Protein mesh-like n=1 Tax=Actinia tenebrosa TaxID=6105 RepID=A0A6P8JA75_ACTTE|nr:protein mesh-like [Actinia tenebrosa]
MTSSRNRQKTALLVFLVSFVFNPCHCLPVEQFYPFGSLTNDRRVPTNDDGSSGWVSITMPFPFFDNYHDRLYVNTNGVVSFLIQVSKFTPDPFPLGNNERLLTAFWADVDTTKGGKVWYRETTDQAILEKATNDIRQTFVKQFNFVATWAFIATWDRVAFFGASGLNRNRTNTFQAILISNGRHSFVRYNYDSIVWTTGTASGGDAQGLGGTPAQCGFNAGDGIRYFTIPGSRTDAIRNLTKTSNVAMPGVWMFRIDNFDIEGGGCNVRGSLSISPSFGSMLGGDNILVAGPCFQPYDRIICKFDGEKETKGTYINAIRAFCAVPMANKTGRVPLRVSRNNGGSFDFHGLFTYVPITKVIPRVTRNSPDTWVEGVNVEITWDSGLLGNSSQMVSVQVSRYVKNDDDIRFHSHYTVISTRPNDGRCIINVPPGQGEGDEDGRFITLVRVVQEPLCQTHYRAAWIWSDVFMWLNFNSAGVRCKNWANNEPNPRQFTEDTTFLACPRNLLQAMADRGRYTEDEFCHTKNEDGCAMYHRGAKLCIRTITPSDQGAGQQCCYNHQGNLMLKFGSAGSLDRVHVDKGIPYISHFFHDIVPYLDCCFLSSGASCRNYYIKRPSDNGQYYEPPRPATAFGDPHMITLDGVEYTFNGYGEFKILNVPLCDFTLQGRMEPLTRRDMGTVYTAFATKENGSHTVQIQLNGRGMVDVLLNGEMAELEQEGITEFTGVSILKYANLTKYSVIFHSGISVTLTGTPHLLQMILLVPQKFKGNTSGLLGYWDDDKEKDFLLPDGTFMETNSSARKIHYDFAAKWETKAFESLFKYHQGKDHSSYSRPSYQPTFINKDDINFNNYDLERQARAACGGNVQCLFDISVTKKVDIGVASRQTYSEFSAILSATTKKACIPIYPNIPGAVVNRNDTPDGKITYQITCSKDYHMKGSGDLSCKDGEWNGTVPTCAKEDSRLTTYLIAGAVVVVVLIIIAVLIYIYCKKSSSKTTNPNTTVQEMNSKPSDVQQRPNHVLSFTNNVA